MTGNYGGQRGRQISLFNVIATPLIIIILASVLLVTNSVGLISALVKGGNITYDETAVTNKKTEIYETLFKDGVKDKNAQNSGIAIMFFYNDDNSTWEYAVQHGENVNKDFVTAVFADKESTMVKYLTDSLTKKVTVDGKEVVEPKKGDELTAAIVGLLDKLAASVDEYDGVLSKKVNAEISASTALLYPIEDAKKGEEPQPVKSEKGAELLSVANGEAITAALVKFTEETGVHVSMTFDTSVRAFGRTIPTTDIFMVVLLLVVVLLCVFNLVKKIRDFKRIKNDFGGQDPSQIKVNARSPYYDEDEDEVVVDDFETVDEGGEESEEAEAEGEAAEEAADEKETQANAADAILRRTLYAESDLAEVENEEDDGDDDQGLALEDAEEDEDNGIIDSDDESYDEDEDEKID